MTPLELLVKELPKRGGWPGDAHGAVQDKSGQIWFYKSGKPYYTGVIWGADPISLDFEWVHWDLRLEMSEDYATAIITREQYEAAIAAQQQVWNGEGLPPVGYKVESFINGEWKLVKVVYTGEPGGKYEALVFDVKTTKPAWSDLFRPIRTKADRKCEEAIQAMYEVVSQSGYDTPEPVAIYDAIAAGKIPGLELSK